MRPHACLRRDAAIALAAAAATLRLPAPGAAAAVTLDSRCFEEVAITGAYVSACMRDAKRTFSWPTVGEITIEQGEVAAGSTGAAVWKAGSLLADHLATTLGPRYFDGKTVVELGCGTGLCGIVAARLGARRVVLTDASEQVLARAPRSLARCERSPLR